MSVINGPCELCQGASWECNHSAKGLRTVERLPIALIAEGGTSNKFWCGLPLSGKAIWDKRRSAPSVIYRSVLGAQLGRNTGKCDLWASQHSHHL